MSSIEQKRNEQLYLLAFSLYLPLMVLRTSFYAVFINGIMIKIVSVICLALLGILELRQFKLDRRDIIGLLMTGIVAYAIFVTSLKMEVLNVLFIFCARKINFKRIAKYAFVITSVCCLFVFISAKVGWIQNYIEYTSSRGHREYLGFSYSLYLPAMLFNIIALYIYLHGGLRPVPALLFSFITFYVYKATDSRLSAMTTLLLIAVVLLQQYIPRFMHNKLFLFLEKYAFVIFAAFFILITMLYDPNKTLFAKLDGLFTGRLWNGHIGLKEYGIPLMPQFIKFVGNGLSELGYKETGSYFYLDSMYVKLLINCGVIAFTTVMLSLQGVMNHLSKKKKYLCLVIGAFIALRCMVDDLSFNIYYNTFAIAIGSILYRSFDSNNKEIKHD